MTEVVKVNPDDYPDILPTGLGYKVLTQLFDAIKISWTDTQIKNILFNLKTDQTDMKKVLSGEFAEKEKQLKKNAVDGSKVIQPVDRKDIKDVSPKDTSIEVVKSEKNDEEEDSTVTEDEIESMVEKRSKPVRSTVKKTAEKKIEPEKKVKPSEPEKKVKTLDTIVTKKPVKIEKKVDSVAVSEKLNGNQKPTEFFKLLRDGDIVQREPPDPNYITIFVDMLRGELNRIADVLGKDRSRLFEYGVDAICNEFKKVAEETTDYGITHIAHSASKLDSLFTALYYFALRRLGMKGKKVIKDMFLEVFGIPPYRMGNVRSRILPKHPEFAIYVNDDDGGE